MSHSLRIIDIRDTWFHQIYKVSFVQVESCCELYLNNGNFSILQRADSRQITAHVFVCVRALISHDTGNSFLSQQRDTMCLLGPWFEAVIIVLKHTAVTTGNHNRTEIKLSVESQSQVVKYGRFVSATAPEARSENQPNA